ncbi:MAG: thiol-disulfide oxidoreductase DCC family protein [Gemmatimonadales bacterium]
MVSRADSPVLLYDGLCGFCNGTVRFVLAHDRQGTMRFAPLQGVFAARVLDAHPGLGDVDSLILVGSGEGGAEQIDVRSEALLGVADYLGGPWRVARLARLVPRPIRDWAYDRFARVRHRVFGRYDSCPVPSTAERARFLE